MPSITDLNMIRLRRLRTERLRVMKEGLATVRQDALSHQLRALAEIALALESALESLEERSDNLGVLAVDIVELNGTGLACCDAWDHIRLSNDFTREQERTTPRTVVPNFLEMTVSPPYPLGEQEYHRGGLVPYLLSLLRIANGDEAVVPETLLVVTDLLSLLCEGEEGTEYQYHWTVIGNRDQGVDLHLQRGPLTIGVKVDWQVLIDRWLAWNAQQKENLGS